VAFLRAVGIIVLVAAIAIVLLKFLPAYVHIHGIESDLNGYGSDLAVECVGSPDCEDNLIEQIEMIRTANGRDVELHYETMDYEATADRLSIQGSRVIDLYFDKYTWRFEVVVKLLVF